MNKSLLKHAVLLLCISSTFSNAHDVGESGLPVCLESNLMVADAMNAPFASASGPGRVLEINIVTGELGVAFENPFTADSDPALCPEGIVCPGPFKPTGVLSGGINGHAFLTSAAQHSIVEYHRDGTPIRTSKMPFDDDPGFGTVPRLLGSQTMPNGNIILGMCDANFFNASNSDQNPDGTNRSNNFFPPIYTTPERSANSRLLVLDQETLQVVDEYTIPRRNSLGHDYWGCPAGILFSDEGLFVSMFHSAAVLVIDWKAGLDNGSRGIGSNRHNNHPFRFDQKRNKANVLRVIDFRPGMPADHPSRRDSLRAISLDEGGNLYAADRVRSRECLEGEVPGTEGGCNPSVFRQRVAVVPFGENHPERTIALDPGVNIIAGIRINRMSALGCKTVDPSAVDPDACNVETLYVAASAFNPACSATSNGPNSCFVPGGGVGEYLIRPDLTDDTESCSGDPQGDNSGCALPIATYLGAANGADNIDPRMLMPIHQAFIQ